MGNQPVTTIRVRQDVWTLSDPDPWHPTILWYARAVKALKAVNDVADPEGWPYLAHIHGAVEAPGDWPAGVQDWNSCQHGSWFFLPWHRLYLHYFERIVRTWIAANGGPNDWALPYWDYDPARPETLPLPPAFVATTWPDGGANPLREEERADGIKDGDPLPADDVELAGWTASFSTDVFTRPSFGGPITGWHHDPQAGGALEAEPHGTVHVDVGGFNPAPGLMSTFSTAPLDPIFWLHHCNLDRLWEVWRNLAGARNPTVPAWLDQSFEVGSGAGAVQMDVADLRSTTGAPLRYRYDGVPVPADPAGFQDVGPEDGMAEGPAPDLVGATDEPIEVGGDVASRAIGLTPQPAPPAGFDATPTRTYATLENITAETLGAGVYVVEVARAGADAGGQVVGRFSTFGLPEASDPDNEHGGSGLTFTYDITTAVEALAGDAAVDLDELVVSVRPARPDAPTAGPISIARIGIYRE